MTSKTENRKRLVASDSETKSLQSEIKSRRGRPPKTANSDLKETVQACETSEVPALKRRGRRPKDVTNGRCTISTVDSDTIISKPLKHCAATNENDAMASTGKSRARVTQIITATQIPEIGYMGEFIAKFGEIKISDNSSRWNESNEVYFPPEFTNKTLSEMAVYNSDSCTYEWVNKSYSRQEWKQKCLSWDRNYPNIVERTGGEKRTLHETMSYRSSKTTNEDVIQWCWDSLSQSNEDIVSKFRNQFRVDMYGNVVARSASDGALCKFDVDHLFPWSRGGRSVKCNFSAVQWDANRRVKREHLIPTLSPGKMLAGISAPQFRALMELAQQRGGRAQRRNIKFEEDRVVNWLTHGPKKSFAISNFQELVEGSTDGQTLWNFFEEHERRQLNQVDTNAVASTPERVPQSLDISVPNRPSVYLRHKTTMIECFGKSTYQLRGKLRSTFGMTFDDDVNRKCWYKLVPNLSQQQDLIARLCESFESIGYDVVMA